jgi:phosphoribosylformylglycinamidine synthase
VNVVCVGIVHPGRYITARVKQPGNHLVLIGASTGRDGLGGASFASRDLSEDSEAEDRPSVQIGDPFTEKLLIEAILEMAETGKVFSCRDLGAAGLAGASSEMCSTFGGLINADQVHQREPNMRPVEIMLAESQERMLIEVATSDVPLIGCIAEKYDLIWSDIGEVIAEPRYIVKFHGKTVADIPIGFLCGDAPECLWEIRPYDAVKPFTPPSGSLDDLLMKVLSHHEVANKTWVIEQYDHDVQVRTVSLHPDAAVLRLEGERDGLAFSCGCNPRQIYLSPYEGAANAVYENAANLACTGADPLCIVNCLNFASPVHADIYWQLSMCVQGMGDMARATGVPVVGGNVSLYNESDEMRTRIKPTPSIGMVGRVSVSQPVKPEPGMGLAISGKEGDHFGGSVLDAVVSCGGSPPPKADPAILDAIRSLVASDRGIAVTDISQGGLASALATFVPGARVELVGPALPALFSETYGRFLIAYTDESSLRGLGCRMIGEVTSGGLEIRYSGGQVSLSKDQVDHALSSFTRTMAG